MRVRDVTKEYRIATTDQLIAMNENAYTREYNRMMDSSLYSTLDPDGRHVGLAMMYHHHKHFEPTTPHLRCRFVLKLRDLAYTDPDPPIVFIDCDIKAYHALEVGR